MTKKKRGHPDIDEVLARPWCFYCERDFDDLKILINHQKAKHFKCERCGRRLNTAGGLSVHMNQVHKENLTAIDNALPNRAGLDIEIFGMEGIPEEIVQQHNQRVLTQFHQAEAERRAATGNPAPGTTSNAAKKPKFESPADLKKRLAEHKAAKLAAEQNGGGSSGTATPTSTPAQPTQDQAQQYPGQPASHQSYAQPPSVSTFGMPQTYAQPQMGYNGYPPSAGYANHPIPQSPYGQQQLSYPPTHQQPYAHGSPPFQQSYQSSAPTAFSPPPLQPQAPHLPTQYSPQVPQNGFTGQVGPHRAFNSASPASQFPPGPHRSYSPAQSGTQRSSSGTLPPGGLGLPQRPAVSAPPVNQMQFQQMHQGVIPVSQSPQQLHHTAHPPAPESAEYNPAAPHVGMPRTLSSEHKGGHAILNRTVPNAAPAEPATVLPQTEQPVAPVSTPAIVPNAPIDSAVKQDVVEAKVPEKKDGKDDKKTKPTRLVYSDNDVSPEEKMAALPRYAYAVERRTVQV